MQEIQFSVTATTFGSPIPYIANGTIIILVQNGQATVGKYEEPTEDEPFPAFSHPQNEDELKASAAAAVKTRFPKSLHSRRSLVFTCPDELAAQAVWR